MPFTRFREGALYSEYYRRVGIDHAVAVPLFVDARNLVSFVLNRRGRDFGERDCALLELVRVHLARLYRQAHELVRSRAALAGLEALLLHGGEGATLRLGARRELLDASPAAAALLARYGLAPLQRGEALPARLDRWLASIEGAADAGEVPPSTSVECGGDRLQLRAYAHPAGDRGLLLLLGEQLALASPQRFAALPLTPREREVLRWVAAGKTDRDIAGLLGISVRTVQKHLERCYIALGVETRTAAVMRALGTLH
jgi:DNA-binding CsgD family transcriptional regulator